MSVAKVKDVLRANIDKALEITFTDGCIFVLEPDHEVDFETYKEHGRWLCHIIKAVSGPHPEFHRLFRPGGLLDIHESDVDTIRDHGTHDVLFSTDHA